MREHPHIKIGKYPTPIEWIERFTAEYGIRLAVKRDDLSGYGRGGSKTRKLAYLFGWLLENGYDELITCMGNISNLIFDIVPLLKRYYIHGWLFCLDIPPMPYHDRIRLYQEILEDIRFIGRSHVSTACHGLSRYISSRMRGKKPALVLPGISHPAAVVGNAMGLIEMVAQIKSANIELPDYLFVSSATGTTVAGFILAERLLHQAGILNKHVRIIGVQVYPGHIRQFTQFMLNWTAAYLNLPQRFRFKRREIEWESGFICEQFGAYNAEIARAQKYFEQTSGIVVDPIFSGKTFAAMQRWIGQNRIPKNSTVLFWHCGYTPDWQKLTRLQVDSGEILAHAEPFQLQEMVL